MSEDFEKYIEMTPIETLIKHELFYQLNTQKEMTYPEDEKQVPIPAYWKITFISNDRDKDGFYNFFESKSPYNLFCVFKEK